MKLYTVKEAATVVGCAANTVNRMVERGDVVPALTKKYGKGDMHLLDEAGVEQIRAAHKWKSVNGNGAKDADAAGKAAGGQTRAEDLLSAILSELRQLNERWK